MAIFNPLQSFDPQTPLDELDNSFVFDNVPVGDAVASASISVSPDGLTLSGQSILDNTVTTWATGGVPGTNYVITCQVTTDQQRVINRSGTLPIVAQR